MTSGTLTIETSRNSRRRDLIRLGTIMLSGWGCSSIVSPAYAQFVREEIFDPFKSPTVVQFGGGTNSGGAYSHATALEPGTQGGATSTGPGQPAQAGGSATSSTARVLDEGTLKTSARPVDGTWRQVRLPVPLESPLAGQPLVVQDETTGWYFTPADPVLAPEPDLTVRFEEVRRNAFARVPWPRIGIQVNPGRIGLVGLPTHFWVTGYDGRAFGASDATVIAADVGPEVPLSVYPADGPRRRDRRLEVRVEARPARYAWAWGDGRPGLTGRSLGRDNGNVGKPASDVVHQYEFTSLRHPQGFPVTLDATFGVAYSVDFDGGSERHDLGTTALRFLRPYPVQEAQAVLVGR